MKEMLIFEIVIILAFLYTTYFAYKNKKLNLLVYGTLFATIFENLNITFFSNSINGYYYGNMFSIYIYLTPLIIILSWGIILFTSYILAERLVKNKIGKVALAILLTVLVDFAIEVISVSKGYWTWIGYDGLLFNAIAPSNFIGWVGVSLGFLVCYEYLSKKRKWMSVFFGYVGFLILSGICVTVEIIFGVEGLKGYITVIIIMGLLFYYGLKELNLKSLKKIDFYLIVPRYLFYLFSIFYFFEIGLYNYPLMILIMLIVYGIDVFFLVNIIKQKDL